MNKALSTVLLDLKERLSVIYGDRLKGVYLFGSHAREEDQTESDVDVLIVLDRVDNYAQEIERTGGAISELSLRSGITISRVFASLQRWQTDQTNFFLNVREEAIPV